VPAAALPATAAEAEFLGMELAPLSQLTAAQFSIPAGTQGLVVVEAEAQAAVAGLKPGDVLVAVNEQPVRTLAEFFQVTRNGALNAARLEVLRGGRTWALELSSATPAAPVRPGAGPEAGPGRQGPPLQVNPIPTQAPGGAPRAPSRF
jgi:serine protease Do